MICNHSKLHVGKSFSWNPWSTVQFWSGLWRRCVHSAVKNPESWHELHKFGPANWPKPLKSERKLIARKWWLWRGYPHAAKNPSQLKIRNRSMSKHKSHSSVQFYWSQQAARLVYQDGLSLHTRSISRVTAYFALAARSFHVSFIGWFIGCNHFPAAVIAARSANTAINSIWPFYVAVGIMHHKTPIFFRRRIRPSAPGERTLVNQVQGSFGASSYPCA